MPKAFCEKPFHTKDEPGRYCNEAIAAEEFQLVDKNGHVRAVLGLNDEDEPRLLFLDGNEKPRLSIYVEEGQPGIDLADKNAHVRATLGLDDNSLPSLFLLDEKETVHASLALVEGEGPSLDLFDDNDVLRASLALLKGNDLPSLALVDKNGQRRRASSAEKDAETVSRLLLFDKNGEVSDMLGGECEEGSA
jgi:hypothetical protein